MAAFNLASTKGLHLLKQNPIKNIPGLGKRNIAVPLHGRFYFLENNAADSRNMFLQGGARLVESLDFLGADG